MVELSMEDVGNPFLEEAIPHVLSSPELSNRTFFLFKKVSPFRFSFGFGQFGSNRERDKEGSPNSLMQRN